VRTSVTWFVLRIGRVTVPIRRLVWFSWYCPAKENLHLYSQRSPELRTAKLEICIFGGKQLLKNLHGSQLRDKSNGGHRILPPRLVRNYHAVAIWGRSPRILQVAVRDSQIVERRVYLAWGSQRPYQYASGASGHAVLAPSYLSHRRHLSQTVSHSDRYHSARFSKDHSLNGPPLSQTRGWSSSYRSHYQIEKIFIALEISKLRQRW
jgi:hypothetical protein